MAVPNTFASATSTIPLANLDGNFAYYDAAFSITSTNITFTGLATASASGFSGAHNGTVGATTPATGAFTTLSANSTVSGAGFSTYLASPPAIGGTAAAAGAFTTLTGTGAFTITGTTTSTSIQSTQSTGTITLGGTAGTGAITVGQSTAAQTLNFGTGATANAITKTINIGTTGVSGSTTNINIGSAVSGALGTITLQNNTTLPSGYTLTFGAGTATTAPIVMTAGTNLTSPVAGAIEFDGNAFYSTDDVTGGRGFIPSVHYLRLTADGTAAGPTIANYFGATSGVSLDPNIFYEVEANLFFTKTTAGTLTFTLTFTQAPVNNEAWYTGSPISGIGTVGAPQTAAIVKSTATAGALPATGLLVTAVNHQYQLSAMFQTNATTGGTLNIQVTSSAGTVTPLTGSYYKITRLPSANSGAFV